MQSTIAQRREAITRFMLDSITESFFLLSQDGMILDVNQAACAILDYLPEQLIGQHVSLIDPGFPVEAWAAHWAEFRQQRNLTFETTHKSRKGRSVPVEVSATFFILEGEEFSFVLVRDITERRHAEQQAEQAKKEWNYAMDFFEDPIYLLNLERRIVRANQAFYQMAGLSPELVVGRHIEEIIHPEGEDVPCPVCQAQIDRCDTEIVMEVENPNNPTGKPIDVVCRIIRDDADEPQAMLMTIKDLSRARQTQEKLDQSQAVFDSTIEGIMITDRDLKIVAVNPAFTVITGYSEAEAVGETPRLLKSERHDRDFYRAIWRSIDETGGWQGEIWNRKKNGELFPEWLTISTIRGERGEAKNYVGVFSDISQLKLSQERLEFLAHHDPLTNLPNRLLFSARLEHAMQQAERHDHNVAVLFLDLDRFKHVNDSLGHSVGDGLLAAVGERLINLVRREDTVARLGGDEFTLLMEGLTDNDAPAVLAEKIAKALAQPFFIEGHELFVEASIGISLYPEDGLSVEQLLQHADAAMYRAKEMGRNTYQFYTEDLTLNAFEHLRIEGQLRHALERQQFILHYQPQVDMKTGRVVGLEALIRWEHPEQGLVPPVSFIPIAEETNLIIPMGDWVLRTACTQAKEWLDSGFEFDHIAVNIAGPQIRIGDLYSTVATVLEETGLPPECLELEITETFIMGKGKPAIAVLEKLRGLGVSLAIDDFGTGYSSLSYLKQLPVDKLKIDRSFVMDIPDDENDIAITRAVIALAQSMDFKVIAEGVEKESQRVFLLGEACDLAQGFLFSRPVGVVEASQYLQQNRLAGR